MVFDGSAKRKSEICKCMFQIIVGLLLIAIGVVLMIVLQGLRRIPADPPQVALVTFLGKRTNRVKKEGWRFFFGHPHIFSYVPIEITRVNQDFTSQKVRTPDNAEVEVLVSITWYPDGDDPKALIAYINSGWETGTKNILQGIVSERIRQWARSLEKCPKTWEEAQASKDEVVEVILETILTRNVLEDELKECRRGNGNFKFPSLGIVISRLNVSQIEIMGVVKEAAEKEAKATQQKRAEIIELEHVKQRIQTFIEMGYSKEQALEIVQTERGKVSKRISETKVNISPETREMIKEVLPPLAGSLEDLIGKNEDK